MFQWCATFEGFHQDVRVYTYTHTHTHICNYTYLRTRIQCTHRPTCTCTHVHTLIHTHTYMHTYVCIYIYIYTHTYMCVVGVCVCVCVCVRVCVCACGREDCARPRVVVFVRLCCCMKNIRTIIIIIILGMCLSVKIFFRRSEIVAIGRLSQTRRTDSVRRSLHSMIRKRSSSKQVRLLSSCVGLPAAESTRDAIERRCADGRQPGTAAELQLHPSGTEQNIHTHV